LEAFPALYKKVKTLGYMLISPMFLCDSDKESEKQPFWGFFRSLYWTSNFKWRIYL